MILINANNIKQGGGLSVLFSFLSYLKYTEEKVVVVIPNSLLIKFKNSEFYNSNNIIVKSVPTNFLYRLFYFNLFVKKICKKFNVIKIYSLGNIALNINIYQVLLIQNAFPFVTDGNILNRLPFKFRIYIKLMSLLIIRQVKYANVIFVQTNTIKNCLCNYYTNLDIRIIPNLQNISIREKVSSEYVYSNINCLFLSNYYPHKNFEILYDLVPKIFDLKLPVTISITLSENEILKSNIDYLLFKYPDILINLGPISYSNIENVYSKYNSIFLPSLVESFSTNYVEALYFNKIIITSDLPFAREVCEDLAFYFDPFDFTTAIDAFNTIINSPDLVISNLGKYKSRISSLNLNNSSKTFKSFLDA